jgi:hypothetical protein
LTNQENTEQENTTNTSTHNVRNNPTVKNILARMPQKVADSFNDEQLTNLMTAVGSRSWGDHAIDQRGTFKIPFYKWRFYYVLLMGRNVRELSRREKKWSLISTAIVSTIFLIFCSVLGLLVLYLIKSALGIDLFPGFSLGIWGWFKGLWV